MNRIAFSALMDYCFSLTTSTIVQNYFSVRQSFGIAKEKCDQFCGGVFSTFFAGEKLVFLVLFWAIGQ